MLYWVKVENEVVTQCWDVPPPEGEDGWREAVEIKPDINPTRQNYNTHSFDISKAPVEIVWSISEVSVDSRKAGMLSENKAAFEKVVAEQLEAEFSEDPTLIYSPTAVATAKTAYRKKDVAIKAATTHDELDAL